ncbi:MAG: CPBP family intramembrane glutamic endopeptidase [Candidatus Sericytochromatia bacterium]|nr:CPBP family intramembrane glutamic endopeptidase [Candidatus Sericytochromatia bacterium]
MQAWYRRVSPGCRLGAWLACVGVAWLAWGGALGAAGVPLEALWHPDRHPWGQRLFLAGAYAALLGTTAWCWGGLQGRPLVALTGPLEGGAGQAARWFLVGLGSLALVEGLTLALGLARWRGPAQSLAAWTVWGEAVLAAWLFAASEELVFRGFVLHTLGDTGAWGRAVWGSAVSYASVHFLRLNVDLRAVALPWLGLVLAGGLFGWLTRRTGSLWAALGLHAGWVALFLACDRLRCLDPVPAGRLWSGGGYPLGGGLGMAAVLALWGLTAWAWRRPGPG